MNHGKGFGDEYKDEYLAVGDFNVFSIDWGDLESWTNYFHAAAITKPVAQYSAQLGIIVNNHYDAQQAFTFFNPTRGSLWNASQVAGGGRFCPPL